MLYNLFRILLFIVFIVFFIQSLQMVATTAPFFALVPVTLFLVILPAVIIKYCVFSGALVQLNQSQIGKSAALSTVVSLFVLPSVVWIAFFFSAMFIESMLHDFYIPMWEIGELLPSFLHEPIWLREILETAIFFIGYAIYLLPFLFISSWVGTRFTNHQLRKNDVARGDIKYAEWRSSFYIYALVWIFPLLYIAYRVITE